MHACILCCVHVGLSEPSIPFHNTGHTGIISSFHTKQVLPNSGLAVCCSKANTQEASVGWKRKVCFIQEAGNLVRMRTRVQEPTQKILLGHESFLRVKGEARRS